MKEEKKLEVYEAPRAIFVPLGSGLNTLVQFSLDGEFDDIVEHDDEW